MTLHIAAFTPGRSVPSARFRVRQYKNDWLASDIQVREHPSVAGAYPPPDLVRRPFWLAKNIIGRLPAVIESRKADLILLQRQFASTINTLERFTGRPRLLDVDDAIWLTSRFQSVARLGRSCDGIICGNAWIADYFSQLNLEVTIVPTAVDVRIYKPAQIETPGPKQLIGWIGTRGNLRFLEGIEIALNEVLRRLPTTDLYIICDRAPEFRLIPAERVIFEKWTEESELTAIQRMHVGLMPLEDTEWARGKCSFKMLQYMACAVPPVVSPVGMNVEVLAKGGAFAATTTEEWIDALVFLLTNDRARVELGATGRQTVLNHYATAQIANDLANVFRRFV